MDDNHLKIKQTYLKPLEYEQRLMTGASLRQMEEKP